MNNKIRNALVHNLKNVFSPFCIDFDNLDDDKIVMIVDWIFEDYKIKSDLLRYNNEKFIKMNRDWFDAINKI